MMSSKQLTTRKVYSRKKPFIKPNAFTSHNSDIEKVFSPVKVFTDPCFSDPDERSTLSSENDPRPEELHVKRKKIEAKTKKTAKVKKQEYVPGLFEDLPSPEPKAKVRKARNTKGVQDVTNTIDSVKIPGAEDAHKKPKQRKTAVPKAQTRRQPVRKTKQKSLDFSYAEFGSIMVDSLGKDNSKTSAMVASGAKESVKRRHVGTSDEDKMRSSVSLELSNKEVNRDRKGSSVSQHNDTALSEADLHRARNVSPDPEVKAEFVKQWLDCSTQLQEEGDVNSLPDSLGEVLSKPQECLPQNPVQSSEPSSRQSIAKVIDSEAQELHSSDENMSDNASIVSLKCVAAALKKTRNPKRFRKVNSFGVVPPHLSTPTGPVVKERPRDPNKLGITAGMKRRLLIHGTPPSTDVQGNALKPASNAELFGRRTAVGQVPKVDPILLILTKSQPEAFSKRASTCGNTSVLKRVLRRSGERSRSPEGTAGNSTKKTNVESTAMTEDVTDDLMTEDLISTEDSENITPDIMTEDLSQGGTSWYTTETSGATGKSSKVHRELRGRGVESYMSDELTGFLSPQRPKLSPPSIEIMRDAPKTSPSLDATRREILGDGVIPTDHHVPNKKLSVINSTLIGNEKAKNIGEFQPPVELSTIEESTERMKFIESFDEDLKKRNEQQQLTEPLRPLKMKPLIKNLEDICERSDKPDCLHGVPELEPEEVPFVDLPLFTIPRTVVAGSTQLPGKCESGIAVRVDVSTIHREAKIPEDAEVAAPGFPGQNLDPKVVQPKHSSTILPGKQGGGDVVDISSICGAQECSEAKVPEDSEADAPGFPGQKLDPKVVQPKHSSTILPGKQGGGDVVDISSICGTQDVLTENSTAGLDPLPDVEPLQEPKDLHVQPFHSNDAGEGPNVLPTHENESETLRKKAEKTPVRPKTSVSAVSPRKKPNLLRVRLKGKRKLQPKSSTMLFPDEDQQDDSHLGSGLMCSAITTDENATIKHGYQCDSGISLLDHSSKPKEVTAIKTQTKSTTEGASASLGKSVQFSADIENSVSHHQPVAKWNRMFTSTPANSLKIEGKNPLPELSSITAAVSYPEGELPPHQTTREVITDEIVDPDGPSSPKMTNAEYKAMQKRVDSYVSLFSSTRSVKKKGKVSSKSKKRKKTPCSYDSCCIETYPSNVQTKNHTKLIAWRTPLHVDIEALKAGPPESDVYSKWQMVTSLEGLEIFYVRCRYEVHKDGAVCAYSKNVLRAYTPQSLLLIFMTKMKSNQAQHLFLQQRIGLPYQRRH